MVGRMSIMRLKYKNEIPLQRINPEEHENLEKDLGVVSKVLFEQDKRINELKVHYKKE